jgi:serine/threonine protein kinase/Tol biopolymer transport system component
MTLSTGTRLGPYEILAPLGAGGMGEVYRARDTRLGRDVAVKVLPDDVAGDAHALARFETEAHAVAALSHPNILALFDVGKEGSVSFVVMELLEGETLRDLLVKGPLALRKALDVALQVAEGLAAAHRKGIVHRDVKPENVFLTKNGHAKLLDFGLARSGPVPARRDETQSPTVEKLTSEGAVVGTVAYMSPEQARGETIDFRSDQFSLGIVLYEMLAGKRPFRGASAAETLAAIIREEPEPLTKLDPKLPALLGWIVQRCFSKDAEERYYSTKDLAKELQNLREHASDLSSGAIGVLRSRRPSRVLQLAAAMGLVAAGVAGGGYVRMRLAQHRPPEFRRLTFRQGDVSRALFVPNSNSILYTASWDGQPPRTYITLPESAGLDRALDAEPQLPMAFNEDGTQVLVLLGTSDAVVNPHGSLAWWPVLGGKPRLFLDDCGWADWAARSQFGAVVRDTGEERILEIRDVNRRLAGSLFRTPGGISYVRISPDETKVAFVHHPSSADTAGEIWVADVKSGGVRKLTETFEDCAGVDWNRSSGEIWFSASKDTVNSTNLWSVSIKGALRRLYALTSPSVLQDISGGRCLLTSGESRVSLIVHRAGTPPRDLTWFGWSLVADLSPDENSVLFFDGGPSEKSSGIWLRGFDGGDAVHLGDGQPQRFAPDGRQIVALTRPLSGPPKLTFVPVETGEVPQPMPLEGVFSSASFLDARSLLVVRSEGGRRDVWRMGVDGSGARPLGAGGCEHPDVSPHGGTFLALCDPGSRGLFIFPMTGGSGRKLFELPPGDRFQYARWDREGKKIFAVASRLRALTLAAESGAVLADTTLPLPAGSGFGELFAAAFNPDATLQAYSVQRRSNSLQMCTGVE